jgi:hypothetical protein
VQFSVPKVATGSNFHPVDHNGTKEALRAIQKHLKAIGVKTSIKTATLSRLDAFKTVQTQEPYQCYHPVLSMLQAKRQSKRDYGTTFLWGNTQQETCVYDKLEEMRRRKQPVVGLPRNSMRFEWRGLKPRKVRDTLGMKTAGDLLEGFDHVQATYKRLLEDQLFKRDVSNLEFQSVKDIEAQLAVFIQAGRRYPFTAWLEAVALDRGVSDFEAVKKAVDNSFSNRAARRKIHKKLEAARLDAVTLRTVAPSKRAMGELYTELKTKVLS